LKRKKKLQRKKKDDERKKAEEKKKVDETPIDQKNPLFDLFRQLKIKRTNDPIIIIDDIQLLFHSVQKESIMLHFISYLTQMAASVMLLGHNDVRDASSMVMHVLKHRADLFFTVKPLTTGFSKDVTGQVVIHKSDPVSRSKRRQQFHYKSTDTGTKVYAPGKFT